MKELLLISSLVVYVLIVSFFMTSISERYRYNGSSMKGIKWTYLDLILVVVSSPVLLTIGAIMTPFAILGVIILAAVSISKPEIWVDWLERKANILRRKVILFAESNKVIQGLLKPISKKDREEK